jgi:hypothetical protein
MTSSQLNNIIQNNFVTPNRSIIHERSRIVITPLPQLLTPINSIQIINNNANNTSQSTSPFGGRSINPQLFKIITNEKFSNEITTKQQTM